MEAVIMNPLRIDRFQVEPSLIAAEQSEPVLVKDEQIIPARAATEVRDMEIVAVTQVPGTDPIILPAS